jgi:hypothetical protein
MKEMRVFSMRFKSLKERLLNNKISAKFLFIVMGIASTAWFLIRVLPKPQRAAYPCMRAAAPIMSGFILYILSLGGITLLFKRTFANLKKARYWSAAFAFVLCFILLVAFNIRDIEVMYANSGVASWTRGVLPDSPNTPMGTSFGVNPGRVVWVHNASATDENCENTIAYTGSWPNQVMDWTNSNAFIMPEYNDQDTINKMADEGIKTLTGESTVSAAWNSLFNNFNLKKKGSASGYVAGQKIFIKVNNGQAGWAVNNSDLSERGNNSATGVQNAAMSNTTPFVVVSIIRQLVDVCGVAQADIYVGEPMTHVYKSLYDAIHNIYPNVKVMDKENKTSLGRTTTSGWTANAITYSDKGDEMPDGIKDALMNEMYNADYMISIPALKAHARAGVTLTAKLHFGSHGDHGGNDWGSFDLHDGLICTVDNDVMTSGVRGNYGMYRVLTDLMGHKKLGGNTILYIMDGLWGGIEATDMPVKWKTAPFNDDFPNSLFFAQDPVALESVCIDFLRAEANVNTAFKDRPFFPAIDDHLHQAAEKANWPSGIVYDPENDGIEISSLGVHEHWNNSTDKQYSKDLFANGTGIDLVSIPSSLIAHNSTTAVNLTVTVTAGVTPLQDAIVIIKGSKYRTDDQGKVVIGNLTNVSALNYTIAKEGYTTFNGQVDINGNTEVTKDLLGTPPISGIDENTTDNNYSLYPNPCVNETNIFYNLTADSKVEISLVSIDGRLVKTVQNQLMSAGEHDAVIYTAGLPKGVYFCRINVTTGGKTNIETIKLKVQ